MNFKDKVMGIIKKKLSVGKDQWHVGIFGIDEATTAIDTLHNKALADKDKIIADRTKDVEYYHKENAKLKAENDSLQSDIGDYLNIINEINDRILHE